MIATLNPQTTYSFIETKDVYEFIEMNDADMDESDIRHIVYMLMEDGDFSIYTRNWVDTMLNDSDLDSDKREYLQWMKSFYDAHPFLNNLIICENGNIISDDY